ncbi:MAG: GNAT family N-acetyltransferase [Clostridiales bacterium]|nr:GNAT family N-acetyltransferase [Clostridiales bacterium]
MVKIESTDQFKEWVGQAKENGFSISNCYYTANKLSELIGQQKLAALKTSFSLLFLEKEDGFYRCSYYLSPEHPVEKINLDQPCVIEYIYKNKLSSKNQTELALIGQMGFVLGRKSGRMVLSTADMMHAPADLSMVEYAHPGDEAALFDLFRTAFDPLYAYFPEKEELTQAIAVRDNPVFCVYEGERLCAALYSQWQNRTASIRMLAVAPFAQGKGYGSALLSRYHKEWAGAAVRFMHWVDSENEAAVQLYKKYGYRFDGCYAYEYVLR